ncbi:hypothetical protein DVA67_020425 [Solirubrobacter sp. CPCC 204708]|uniref:SIR2-like domain-containing protein n=1 Tax=Solirubrobacter deserti TaxID=2282478 RepID=A0ABT4RP91_9ACTN|nr:hypothetical protein [Solirubrobacter deserti]MBE2318359.1 hypothetical protein [Solirubrobacter deserti]MDA0140121.1 hypothetical protein [Solirubrobacter deserti]
MKLSEEQCGELQLTLATETPVLVLGPGCHRVGFDAGPAWQEVVRRLGLVWARIGVDRGFAPGSDEVAPDLFVNQARGFLENLLASKASAETRERGRVPIEALQATRLPETWKSLDGPRTHLAASLLGVLYESTRCLGNVIATGESPVTNWLTVSHPGETRSSDQAPEGAPAADAAEADVARGRAGRHLESALRTATYLHHWSQSPDLEGHDLALHMGNFKAVARTAKLTTALSVLKIEAVQVRLKTLETTRFKRDLPLDGALIEWLADLFWHLMVTDSRVPPSQAEVAFYVNLKADADDTVFRRPGAGEVRAVDADDLNREIGRLLRTYDSGPRPADAPPLPRDQLLQMLAACVLQAFKPEGRRSVVLSSDFDLSFERTLLEMSAEDQKVHLVVPVWRCEGTARVLDWLFTTIERTDADVTEEALTQPESWALYGDVPSRDAEGDPVAGPIVVKLNGSPLVQLDERPDGVALTEEETVKIATIFTEYDSLQAIISFTEGQHGLAADLINEIQWRTRSWIVLGDSFPHWLPRLRLIYNARSHFRRSKSKGRGRTEHFAIDRRFGWPERPLLDVLRIRGYEEDLGELPLLVDRTTAIRDGHPAVKKYLANVRERLKSHRERLEDAA